MSYFDYLYIIDQVSQFDSAIFDFFMKLVLVKSNDKTVDNKVLYGTIIPIKKKDLSKYKLETIEYEEIRYYSRIITKEELMELLTKFGASTEKSISLTKTPEKYKVSNSTEKILRSLSVIFPIDDTLSINLNGLSKNDRVNFSEYDSSLGSRLLDSHTSYYSIDFGSHSTKLEHISDLYSVENPFYPSAADLILDKFSADLIRFSGLNGQLLLKLPKKFKGEIEEIQYIDGHIDFKVKLQSVKKAVLKVFIKDRYKNLGKSYTIPIKKKTVKDSIQVPFEPNWLDVILIDENDKIIHKIRKSKEFHDELSRKPEAIKRRISYGEGLTCDFKESLPANDNLIKLLCAFANTEGGDIILGVDRNGFVVGLTYPGSHRYMDFDSIEVHVQNLIETNTDPPVQVIGFPVILEDVNGNDCEIGVIRVKESRIPVKNLIDNEYYIRRGSTKRIAKPTELSELFQKKATNSYI